jgi:hypothetical protein
MASGRLSGFASAFDDLLERGRREMDALSGRPRVDRTQRASEGRSSGDPAGETAARPARSRTPAEHVLDGKLGSDWRHEVVERIREGGEMVVRCRVHSPSRGITRTVYGAAPLSKSAARASGTSGGVAFSLGGGASTAGGGAVQSERDAERLAVESALEACARLL